MSLWRKRDPKRNADRPVSEGALQTRVGPIRGGEGFGSDHGSVFDDDHADQRGKKPEWPLRAESADAPAERRAAPRPGFGRFMRLFLPLAAIGLVAAVLLQSKGGGGPLPLIDKVKLGAGIQVVNPRYNGATADGSPFSISADIARPDGPDPVEIALEKVAGTFGVSSDNSIAARANDGIYNRIENTVQFSGDVTVESGDGYRMRSNSAEVDLDAMTIHARERVFADGPVGDLEAGSMRASQGDGGVVWFENGVQMTIRKLVESRATGE